MNRTKNATRNILFGLALRLYQIIVPFLMRSAIIYFLGVKYLGLNGLFTSVLQVLNLAELGVGSAMIYSMYKPIANGDKDTICALLKLYRKYYFLIGLVIAIVGIAITPFIPYLIKDTVPENLNIYILYIFNLFSTVITYWLYAYKNSLLQAHQRSDYFSKVNIVTMTLQYILQLLVLWLFNNYYLYIIVSLFTTALTNIIIAVIASKLYPEYKPSGSLPDSINKDINRRIRDLFTAKLGNTVVNSADTIVISSFLGLEMLAIYQNYYYIMTSIISLIAIVFSSCLAGVGNSLITESKEKNYNDFRVITLLINFITTVCMSCFISLYQPFITLWVGKELTLGDPVVILLCVYFYFVVMQQIPGMYKDAAGVWHKDRFRPLIASLVNLVLNVSLVNVWGIYAIILSTVFSYLLVAIPWLIHNLFMYVFKMDWKKYVVDMILYFVYSCFISGLCYGISLFTRDMALLLQLLINGIICVILSVALWYLMFNRSVYFIPMINLIDRITHCRFHKILNKFIIHK